ncbi:MAG: transcriptional regulator, LacI family [Clostridia bacterium]|jgi:LacI family transcriptional regulator|nr:transcriptional regulator, LacI family [Clostridia bacterium]
MAVTIKQIADLSNVSRGTVDKVLNNRPGVKEETKNKVLQIAKELNYQPNFLGKALVKSKDPLKLGVILTPEYNPFVQEIIQGINSAYAEFSAFGIDITIKMLTSLEPAEQISILNELETDNVSGIAVFPIDDLQVKSKINQLSEKGISIITFNSKLDEIKDLCFVGQNHYKGGRTAAGLLGKLLPDGGKIGVIISSNKLSCHQDRLRGFKDKLDEAYHSIEIIGIQANQDRKDEAFKATLEYCNNHLDLKGVYITGGGIAGVGSALKIVEKNQEIKVICHDLIPDTLELLRCGTVDFALGQSPELQGYQLIKILFEYLIKNQKPQSDYIEIPITIATEDTI